MPTSAPIVIGRYREGQGEDSRPDLGTARSAPLTAEFMASRKPPMVQLAANLVETSVGLVHIGLTREAASQGLLTRIAIATVLALRVTVLAGHGTSRVFAERDS